jgi:hypothetical protein
MLAWINLIAVLGLSLLTDSLGFFLSATRASWRSGPYLASHDRIADDQPAGLGLPFAWA